jgi:hypothetical protein
MNVPYNEFVMFSIGILILSIAAIFLGKAFNEFVKGILSLIKNGKDK